MRIQSTRELKGLIRRELPGREEVEQTRVVEVTIDESTEAWDDELSLAAGKIGADIGGLSLRLDFDPNDPAALAATSRQLQALVSSVEDMEKRLAPKPVTAGLSFTRTGTGVVLGATGGYGAGLLLQEMGKLGASSGNPYLSNAALACTVLGAALGGAIGSGLVDKEMLVEISKLGAKATG